MNACDYAACTRVATENADGWNFCQEHIRHHLAVMRDRPVPSSTDDLPRTPADRLREDALWLIQGGVPEQYAAERLGVRPDYLRAVLAGKRGRRAS
jgi:hypothetical protein